MSESVPAFTSINDHHDRFIVRKQRPCGLCSLKKRKCEDVRMSSSEGLRQCRLCRTYGFRECPPPPDKNDWEGTGRVVASIVGHLANRQKSAKMSRSARRAPVATIFNGDDVPRVQSLGAETNRADRIREDARRFQPYPVSARDASKGSQAGASKAYTRHYTRRMPFRTEQSAGYGLTSHGPEYAPINATEALPRFDPRAVEDLPLQCQPPESSALPSQSYDQISHFDYSYYAQDSSNETVTTTESAAGPAHSAMHVYPNTIGDTAAFRLHDHSDQMGFNQRAYDGNFDPTVSYGASSSLSPPSIAHSTEKSYFPIIPSSSSGQASHDALESDGADFGSCFRLLTTLGLDMNTASE
ncbi:hypothetical protein DFH11DRAFT_1578526 [Phellopilus nigrolimitatus]|nr:hypothetical protein DFH11DRAFT_1578526 [Phellopilus nigrolimitatus]